MHIPKLVAMISVVTLGAGSLSVQAQRPDTDMQAIAREQMRQALSKLDAQNPGTATNTAPVAVKPKPVKKVVAPPPAQPTMVIVPAAPTPVAPPPVAVPPPAMQVKTVPPPVATPAPAATAVVQPPAVSIPEQPKPVAVAKKKAPPIKATGFSQYSPIAESPGTGNPPVTLVIPGENPVMAPGNTLKRSDERKAREEVRKSLGETGPTGQTEAKPEAKFPVEAKMGTDARVTAHPTLVPGSKEDRLSELLDLYKADKISPAEYHAQRAKILAEP